MAKDTSDADSQHKRLGLLKDQVHLVKRKDSDRHEIAPIQDQLSFEKGFFIVIRACQLLAQKNDGIILVGVAGPSGAGKTVFTEKILNFMPSIAVISMDNYNDASRIVDGNFDGESSSGLLLCDAFFYHYYFGALTGCKLHSMIKHKSPEGRMALLISPVLLRNKHLYLFMLGHAYNPLA